MNENHFEERLDRLEKTVTEGFARMEVGFAHVNGLIETLANTCAREFALIAEHFTQVDGRLDDIEGKIESFAHRVDFEAENATSSPNVFPNLSRRFDIVLIDTSTTTTASSTQ